MDIVDRLKNKEEAALVELMNRYGDYLLRMAYLLIKDHQRAEEAVQDTFVIAFQKIGQLDQPEQLKSWLTTIVLNACRSQMRTWSFKSIFPNFEAIKHQTVEQTSVGPEEDLLKKEGSESLTRAIHRLDYKYREIITLHYFNELKIKEITALTEIKESTVKTRLKRAKKLLKEHLLEEGNDERGKANEKSS